MDEPAPPGYYYQPSGGGYAQYIGQSIPSNFQLPPMAPHYQDPNAPSPMPGFYHIDSFGNPPQYLGVNPPKRERGNQNQRQGMSSSSAGSHRSEASNRSKGSYFEYGMIRTDENPQGEFFYSYTDSTGAMHYMVPDNKDAYTTSNNPSQSKTTQYKVPKNVDPNSQGAYSNSNNSFESTQRYNRPPPSRLKSTKESSSSIDYIPPFNTRPQGYEGPQNNQRYNEKTKDRPTSRIKPTNESSPSMDYIPPFNTRPQGYEGIQNNQRYNEETKDRSTSRIKPTNESSPSMDYIPPFNTRPQGYGRAQNIKTYNTESRDAYQWPRQGHSSQTNPSVSLRDRNNMDPYSPQRNNRQEDFPSNSAREAYYAPNRLDIRGQYVSRDQSSAPTQSRSHISADGSQSHSHGSAHGSGQILSNESNYNTSNLQSTQNLQQESPQDFSRNNLADPNSRQGGPQAQGRRYSTQDHGHSHGGIRYGQY